jgi:hypothetical protein
MSVLLHWLFTGWPERQAYLDPGSGSILIQVLLAGLLGFLVMVRASWGKIKAFFGRKPAQNQDNSDDEP